MGPGAPPDALLPAQGDSLLPPEGPGNQHFSLSSHQHGRRLVLLVSSPGCFWNVLSKPGLAKKPLSGEPQVLAIEAYRTAGGGPHLRGLWHHQHPLHAGGRQPVDVAPGAAAPEDTDHCPASPGS